MCEWFWVYDMAPTTLNRGRSTHMARFRKFPPENAATYTIKVTKNSPPVTVHIDPDPEVAARKAADMFVALVKCLTRKDSEGSCLDEHV